MSKQYMAKQGCPICRSDVVGTRKAGYLCRKCMVLFREDIVLQKDLFMDYKDPYESLK